MVEHEGVEHVAGAGIQAETHIAHSQDGEHAGKFGFDVPDGVQSFHGAAAEFLVAAAQSESEGIDDQVLGWETILAHHQVIEPPGHGQLPFAALGHAFFVNGEGHYRGAVVAAEIKNFPGLAFAVFEVDGVHHAFARRYLQRLLDNVHFRGVDHQGQGGLRDGPAQELFHVPRFVAPHVGHAHIQHVSAFALLLPGNAH